MTPKLMSQRPSRMASAGMMVCIGRLPGPNALGWPACKREAGAAIGEHDAGLFGADADAEMRIERIDERHRHAVAVDHGEIDRVAARRRRARQLGALVQIDLGRRASWRSPCRADRRPRRAYAPASAIWVSRTAKPKRAASSTRWKRSGPERIERGEIEILQDVEHHQRGEPLPVRRNLDQIEPAIIGRDRRHRVAAMAREIVRGEERAARGKRRRHVVGDLALVEGARALGGNGLERRGQRRKADHVAFLRRRAVEQIMLGRARIGLQLADIAAPVPGDARGHREAALGIFDRGRQRAVEAEAAMRLEDRLPGIERARHGDGVDRSADLAQALRAQRLVRGLGAGAAGAVIAPHRLARLRHQAITIAADAGHMRLDHAQRRHRRHRGIGRVAAGAQRVDGGQASPADARSPPCRRRRSRASGRGAGNRGSWSFQCRRVRTGCVRRFFPPARFFPARARRFPARVRCFRSPCRTAPNAAST